MVRIPSEYQEVEYIESTGTQYFWTDIDIQEGIAVDSVQTFATGNDSYLFGGQCESGVVSGKTCFNGNYSNKVQGAYTNNYYLVGTVVQDNQTKYHIVSIHADNRRICVVDGIQVLNSSADAFIATVGKCVCFGWNKAGTPANFYKGKIYSLKVSKASELLANYIPCYRKSDNEIGMYDTVSGAFYTNSGTGTFLVGNPVEYSTINLLELRRLALLYDSHWNYFFKAEEDGRIPKARIPLKSGQRVYIEWDTSRLASRYQAVFSFYNQVSSMNDVCKGWSKGGYPICWESGDIGNDIFYVGHATLIMPKDLTMFIGYWQDSDTTDRRIYADYLKIKIL